MLMPLILAMLPSLVVANPAAASGPEDGLEPDNLDNGKQVELNLGADSQSDPPEEAPLEPATNGGILSDDGVDTNETGSAPASDDSSDGDDEMGSPPASDDVPAVTNATESEPGNDDVPEDAKPQKTVCGTAPTALQHQPGSCASPYDPPPNIEPVCSWKIVEIVTSFWTPPVIRWVPRVVGWAFRWINGVKTKFQVTEKVAEVVEEGYWTETAESIRVWWCPS